MGSGPESGSLRLGGSGPSGSGSSLPAAPQCTRLPGVRVRSLAGHPDAPASTRWSGIQI